MQLKSQEKLTLRLWSPSLVVLLGRGVTTQIQSNPGEKLWELFTRQRVFLVYEYIPTSTSFLNRAPVGLTVINPEVGGADGLPRSICGNAGVGARVLGAHVHQDEAVLASRARDFVSLGVGLDPQDVFHRFLLQPRDHRRGGAWRSHENMTLFLDVPRRRTVKQSRGTFNEPSTLTDRVMLAPCFTFLLLNLSMKRGGTRGTLGSVEI